MRILIVALALLGLTGCETDDSQSNGPGINVHCDAAFPTGPTTVKVDCPPPA
jgi:hypothetical protein